MKREARKSCLTSGRRGSVDVDGDVQTVIENGTLIGGIILRSCRINLFVKQVESTKDHWNDRR